jgi:methionine-gamma-lyase
MKMETLAVRGGRGHMTEGSMGEGTMPHVPAIDFSSTYGFDSSAAAAESMDALLAGDASAPNPIYSRLYNPTVAGFEKAFAGLEHADGAVAFSSGMAAITALLMAVGSEMAPEGARRGRHIVAIRPIYGGTDHVLTSGLLGTEVTWAAADEVADAIRPDTALVILETPANPTLAMVDIRGVVAQVREAEARLEGSGRIPVAVDSTFATPVLQQPLLLGADFAVHSATKFIGGHGDVLAGVVATSEEWAHPLRQVRMLTGAVLHPLAGYLLHRGLQTLPVRVLAQQDNARELADRLAAHPAVMHVYYPGITDDPTERRLLATQQSGPGSILSFRVHGGLRASQQVIESLNLITRAVSLGSVDTLIQAPAALTHRVVDPEAREASGVYEDLLRVSVGLEAVEDLWADLDQALSRRESSAA